MVKEAAMYYFHDLLYGNTLKDHSYQAYTYVRMSVTDCFDTHCYKMNLLDCSNILVQHELT